MLCAIVNNVLLIVGDAAELPQLVSVLLAWLAGGTLGYLWHQRLTYRASPSWRSYLQLLAGSMIAIPLAWGVIAILQGWLGLTMWLAAPIATVAMFAYNYLNARLAILRRLPRSSKDLPAHGK